MKLKAKWTTKHQVTKCMTVTQIGIYHFIQMYGVIEHKKVMSRLKVRLCDISGLVAMDLLEIIKED